jgi:phosphatidate cytidylyltransferase
MNETFKRGISGAVFIALLITSILYATESFILLFGVFLLIATYEFCGLIKVNRVLPIAFVTLFYTSFSLLNYFKPATEKKLSEIFNQQLTFDFNKNQLDLILLSVCLFVSVKCIVFLFDDKIQTLDTFSKYIYLIGYILLPFIFITKISFGVTDYNPKIIIGLFILIWTNDTFAYLVGKSVGKHKLLERISPKKTIEGFLGGVIFAVFAGFLISKLYIQPNPNFSTKSIIIWTTIALLVGIIGTIGDLIESKFKRIAGVKDSGKIMPGHGGILDRLDSVIFVAPFIYLFYKILNYVS